MLSSRQVNITVNLLIIYHIQFLKKKKKAGRVHQSRKLALRASHSERGGITLPSRPSSQFLRLRILEADHDISNHVISGMFIFPDDARHFCFPCIEQVAVPQSRVSCITSFWPVGVTLPGTIGITVSEI